MALARWRTRALAAPFYSEKEEIARALEENQIAKIIQIGDGLAIDTGNDIFGLKTASLGRTSRYNRLNEHLPIDVVFVGLFLEFHWQQAVPNFLIRFQLSYNLIQSFGGNYVRRLYFRDEAHEDSDELVVGVENRRSALRWTNGDAEAGVG